MIDPITGEISPEEKIIVKLVKGKVTYSCSCGAKKIRESETAEGTLIILCMACGADISISLEKEIDATKLVPYSPEFLTYWEIPF